MVYFWNERYMLEYCHDEVVHGKATILQKMWGEYDLKFQQAKTLYTYMYTHPGKKLNFMGNEIGQFREWMKKKNVTGCCRLSKASGFPSFYKRFKSDLY